MIRRERLDGMPLYDPSPSFHAGYELGVLCALMADDRQQRPINGLVLRVLDEQLHTACQRLGWVVADYRPFNDDYNKVRLVRR